MSLDNVELFSTTARSVYCSLDKQCKCALIMAFWPHINTTENNYVSDDYAVLFDFIGRTFQDLHRHATHFADTHLDGFLATVEQLHSSPAMTRRQIVAAINAKHINFRVESIRRSVELTARLWSGVNIESYDPLVSNKVPQGTRIEWPDDRSLLDVIAAQFQRSVPYHSDNNLVLDGRLTAVNLRSRRGVEILWTDNLADHLKLHGQKKDRSLTVFRQKTLLVNHRRAAKPIIPIEITKEAIRTLDFLFPFGDEKTSTFLNTAGVNLHVADTSIVQRAISTTEFNYWRSEISQLVRLWEAPPETLGQTLRDTENFNQFMTIWVAILGVFLMTILFGILTTVYAIKQYRVAVNSYDLALTLACLENPGLLGFCA